MKLHTKILTKEDISFLISWGQAVLIPNDFDFVYEKQIPCLAVALIDGRIETIKRSKVVETIPPSTLFGIHQIMNNEKVKRSFRIKAGSTIVLISKSEIMDAIKSPKSKLMQLVRKFL